MNRHACAYCNNLFSAVVALDVHPTLIFKLVKFGIYYQTWAAQSAL